MPYVTIAVGAILCFIGLFGYFGSAAENPSLTALIPLLFGAILAVCGIIARNPNLRKHVMHFAVTVGLVGFLMAFGRLFMKLNVIVSDDPTVDRFPIRIVFAMGVVCLLFVVLCIGSFIAARRRRNKAPETASAR